MKAVLSIAGSDSGGGAGIQGDIKTCSALGVFATTAITAITSQNTLGVRSIQGIDKAIVRDQIQMVLDDFPIKAIKTGMLFSKDIIEVVVEELKKWKGYLIVDPVMVSTSGAKLLLDDAIEIMKYELFPLSTLVTPNLPEMEVILSLDIDSEDKLIESCHQFYKNFHSSVLLKGGHRTDKGNNTAIDYYYNGKELNLLESEKYSNNNNHGTGCSLSSAIASYLSNGHDLTESLNLAKEYISGAIKAGIDIGKGSGPVNHFWMQK